MRLADVTSPTRGTSTELEELVALRFPARQLKLTRPRRALSALAGPNKSNFRGRGIDFEEVRRYQAGDDIRAIDWRVTARTGSAHTKMFREERERPVLVVVDQRSGMYFGSRCCFKSILAAHIASLIAWSALNASDRVGGLVFNELGHREIRPRRSRRTVLALLSQIVAYSEQLPLNAKATSSGFADMLANLRRIARPGSSLFLVSDFAGAHEPLAREHFYQLAQHTEITAIGCHDFLETELPPAGRYAVTNGELRVELDTGGRRLRDHYASQIRAQRRLLSTDLMKLGIPLIQVATHEPPFKVLNEYYGEQNG